MSSSRFKASTNGQRKASATRSKEQPATGANKVLAERNQAVVAVGAWVEGGQDFLEHPSTLALHTEEIQAEKRREDEESLRRFQDEVRHRVAQQAQVSKKRRQPRTESSVKPDGRLPQQRYEVWTPQLVSAGGAAPQRLMEGSAQQSVEDMRQVRLRLAACRMIPHEEVTSDLPGGHWNISPTRHGAMKIIFLCLQKRAESHLLRAEQEVEDKEDDHHRHHLFASQHECPLVQQKLCDVLWDSDKPEPDPGFQSSLRVPHVLWPLTDQEDLKRQRQSQFLLHRRLYMNMEREQVKENKQQRKHLKRTARIKAEREQVRLEEERKMERVRQLAEARRKLEERELLVLERLKLEEEEEERAEQLQRRRQEEKGEVAARFIEALRAQMKERLSQEKLEKLELLPLCCCASTFWDSHPDTCANNCVFHNNPKAYAKALHSAMLSLDLR